ncbi:MAG: serine/threonine-protein kinase [Candidatus Promineifilaceae bacterium]|nr:serine/threonine-protein kinase [Candidatus Promineifilaceae bacterium]
MLNYNQPMTTTTTLPLTNNRYQLSELLGSGGMGQVFRAQDRHTGQEVALKRMMSLDEPATAVDHGAIASEFRLLSSLSHPHIIPALDFDFDDAGRPFYTMDYLPAAQNIVAYSREEEQSQTIHCLRQMFAALAYLHERQILHRDLKPGNVLVAADHLYVLDFGLAAISARSTADAQKLQGTAAYLAPELLRGAPPSASTDIYACGVIAYECLAGHHPFDTRSMNRLMLGVLYEETDSSSLPLHPTLCELLSRLLSRDPQKRPSAEKAFQKLTTFASQFLKI